MLEITKRLKEDFAKNRTRVLNGSINCIPSPLPRFRKNWPGIQQRRIYLISGGTKAAKSQITNYLFIINIVFYCYKNPGKVKPKIFYFPLEMTKEEVTEMIICYVINYLTKGKTILSPTDLESVDERKPLSQEVLDLMETKEFNDIMSIYESIVTFYDEQNRVGIYKTMNNYAHANGEIYYKEVEVTETDEFGRPRKAVRKLFDYYVANDPDEYVICIVDHVSLLSPVKGEDLRETISQFAKDIIDLRNKYNYIFAIVQQQNIESTGLEAFKANKIRPTVAGLADCKDIGKACNMMLGITNPHYFEMPEYQGYDIRILRGHARFLEITINRNGPANDLCPLYFEGACNDFRELPLPSQTAELNAVYNYIKNKSKVFFIKSKRKSKDILQSTSIFSRFAHFYHKFINN